LFVFLHYNTYTNISRNTTISTPEHACKQKDKIRTTL